MSVGTRTVLIVDDDASLRRMLKLTLRDDGFRVCCAIDGAQALEEVERCAPDVIVLDLQMPVMDGRTFYRRLREGGCETPVLVVSADGAAAAARELNANGYLAKPFDPDVLTAKIAALAAA